MLIHWWRCRSVTVLVLASNGAECLEAPGSVCRIRRLCHVILAAASVVSISPTSLCHKARVFLSIATTSAWPILCIFIWVVRMHKCQLAGNIDPGGVLPKRLLISIKVLEAPFAIVGSVH